MQDRNLIGGTWVGAHADLELDVVDPARDTLIARVPRGGEREAHAAIAAAAAALPDWRAATAHERGAPLRRLAALMLERQDGLAALLTREQGKPLAEARGEIAYAASFIDWAAEEGKRLCGEVVPASSRDKRILVLRQPVGVCACITPWNFPAAMITRKLGPALASGCTMVVKPAEQTPLTALALGELCREAGLPDGVVNIVTGDPVAIGRAFFANPALRKLSFTGSTEVGKLLMRQAADRVVRLSLELGGHAPFIIFDDADVDAAVRGALAAKFRNAGQTCIAANRFYVQAGIYDRFVGALSDALASLKVGPGDEAGVLIGPLIDDAALVKVERHVADARQHGASVRVGGMRVRPGAGLADRFYAPTLIEGVSADMLCSREETFGPVCPVQRFEHEADAIALANASDFGLAAYFYTRDAARLVRVAEALDYGIIGANDGAPSTAQAPFGGMKQSGFGREGGRWVMEAYTETKYVSWGIA